MRLGKVDENYLHVIFVVALHPTSTIDVNIYDCFVNSALNKFRDLDRMGTTKTDRSSTSLKSVHQNAIK